MNSVDKTGSNALHCAALQGHVSIVKALVPVLCDVNLQRKVSLVTQINKFFVSASSLDINHVFFHYILGWLDALTFSFMEWSSRCGT